jgi:hypothetical protein
MDPQLWLDLPSCVHIPYASTRQASAGLQAQRRFSSFLWSISATRLIQALAACVDYGVAQPLSTGMGNAGGKTGMIGAQPDRRRRNSAGVSDASGWLPGFNG